MKTASLVLAIFLALGVANAEIITIEVTATVTVIQDYGPNGGYFGGNISLGDIITMIYTYDTETPDSYPGEYTAYYLQESPNYLNLALGGYSFTNSETFGIFVHNSSRNFYQVGANFSETFLPLFSANMGLSDSTGSAFSDTSLPIPNLSKFDRGGFLEIYSSRNFIINSEVNSITIIPEPMTLLLFGFGGLIVSKSRKHKIKGQTK